MSGKFVAVRTIIGRLGRARYYLPVVLLLGVFLFSGWQLYAYISGVMAGQALADELAEKAVTLAGPVADPPTTDGQPGDDSAAQTSITVDFDTLLAENEDVVAWLYCPDTPINYPVAQGDDNVQYLRHMLNGEYNMAGTLFMDYRNSADITDWNTVIYGHNMRTNTMFGSLSDYSSQEYYEAHPVWYLLTPGQDYQVDLLAGYVTTTDSMAYSIPMTYEDKLSFVQSSLDASRFASDAAVGDDDVLVTFSTCSSASEESRFVLIGVLREFAQNAAPE